MTRRAWLVIAVAIVCAGVLTTGAVTVAATETVLVVTDDGGEEMLVTPVDEGAEITVEYTHASRRRSSATSTSPRTASW